MIVPVAVASGERVTVGSLTTVVLLGVDELSGVGLGCGVAVAATVRFGVRAGGVGVSEGVVAAPTAVCRIAQTASNCLAHPSVINSVRNTGTIPSRAGHFRIALKFHLGGCRIGSNAKRARTVTRRPLAGGATAWVSFEQYWQNRWLQMSIAVRVRWGELPWVLADGRAKARRGLMPYRRLKRPKIGAFRGLFRYC